MSLISALRCVALWLGALLFLGGCASFAGSPPDYRTTQVAEDKLYYQAVERYYRAASDADRKSVRNQFIELRAGVIDKNFAEFKSKIYSQRVGSDVGVDVAVLGLNAVGAVASGGGVKTGLHVLSGGILGGKASIDKNVYFDRTLPAMLAQMDGLRATIRLRLLKGMSARADQYPLLQSESDLQDYYQAGTFAGAISGITTRASLDLKTAGAELEKRLSVEEISSNLQAKGFAVVSAVETTTSAALLACVGPNSTRHAENLAVMRKWLLKEKFNLLPPTAIGDFLGLPQFEELRKKALGDAILQRQFKDCRPTTQ